jgi:hypothetical protein
MVDDSYEGIPSLGHGPALDPYGVHAGVVKLANIGFFVPQGFLGPGDVPVVPKEADRLIVGHVMIPSSAKAPKNAFLLSRERKQRAKIRADCLASHSGS